MEKTIEEEENKIERDKSKCLTEELNRWLSHLEKKSKRDIRSEYKMNMTERIGLRNWKGVSP